MTIKESQDWVQHDWSVNSKVTPTLEAQLLFAIEEFGEVAEAIRKRTVKNDHKTEDGGLGSEFADLLVTIVTLANTFDVDLTDEIKGFQTKLAKRRS